MQRVNGHRFYYLAIKIQPLIQLSTEATFKEVFFEMWEARAAVIDLFDHMPLRVAVAPANKMISGIDSVMPREWPEAVKLFSSEDKIGYTCYAIRQGAKEFETVLEAELQSLDTYLVSQKGTHSTPDLIERAEIMFPTAIRNRLPPQAIIDIRHAGRCLALDNPTASGFHILRAVESVMGVYFKLVTGNPLPTRMRNWGVYIKTLRKHPAHSDKVVTFLDHIRDSYRNPILHPEISLEEDEAEALLGAAATAIRMLVLEIQALENRAQSLPLPLPSPNVA